VETGEECDCGSVQVSSRYRRQVDEAGRPGTVEWTRGGFKWGGLEFDRLPALLPATLRSAAARVATAARNAP
jgi:hypothetical protein